MSCCVDVKGTCMGVSSRAASTEDMVMCAVNTKEVDAIIGILRFERLGA